MLTGGLAAHPNSGAKTGYDGIIDIFLMDINMAPKSFKSFPGGSDSKESDCNAGDLGSFPGLERYPAEGNGNPLQYSCLENSMDRGAWQATVHEAAKHQT